MLLMTELRCGRTAPSTIKLEFPNPVTSCAVDVVSDVVNDKNAMPNFDNARTIEIWALLEFAGKIWACVKTDWIAIVRDLPLARSDLNELFNAESNVTCEHCKFN